MEAWMYPLMKFDVFVSYSHRDSALVLPFVHRLRQELATHGFGMFCDETSKPDSHRGGLNHGLSEAVAGCQACIVFISDNYLSSQWCTEESYQVFLANYQRGKSEVGAPPTTFVAVAICEEDLDVIEGLVARWVEAILSSENVFSRAANQAMLDQSGLHLSNVYSFVPGEALLGYLLNEVREILGGLARTLLTPGQAWAKFWHTYKFNELGPSLDVASLLPWCPGQGEGTGSISLDLVEEADQPIIALFRDLTTGLVCSTVFFDEGFQTQEAVFPTKSLLRAVGQSGHPLAVLSYLARHNNMTREFQHSYYAFNAIYGPNRLVDAIAVACLAACVDTFCEGIINLDQLRELVIEPLCAGQDILGYAC